MSHDHPPSSYHYDIAYTTRYLPFFPPGGGTLAAPTLLAGLVSGLPLRPDFCGTMGAFGEDDVVPGSAFGVLGDALGVLGDDILESVLGDLDAQGGEVTKLPARSIWACLLAALRAALSAGVIILCSRLACERIRASL